MRICVISNSHGASLSNGWQQVKDAYPNVDVTFFASHGASLRTLEVKKGTKRGSGVLFCRNTGVQEILELSSGGLKEIDISQYDAFLLYGIRLKFPLIERGTSRAVIHQTYHDCVKDSINYITLSKIRTISKSVKVFVGHEPVMSRQLSPKTAYPRLEASLIPYDKVFKGIKAALKQPKTKLLEQPKETLAEGLITKDEFSKGSIRLDSKRGEKLGEHRETDIVHMNADFGRLYWETHLPTILKAVEPKKQ